MEPTCDPASGPSGRPPQISLFLYNPKAHQWNQSFISSSMGVLNSPIIASFKDNVGQLFSGDAFKDRSVLVEGTWSHIESNSHQY
jgi:hypothetical protein